MKQKQRVLKPFLLLKCNCSNKNFREPAGFKKKFHSAEKRKRIFFRLALQFLETEISCDFNKILHHVFNLPKAHSIKFRVFYQTLLFLFVKQWLYYFIMFWEKGYAGLFNKSYGTYFLSFFFFFFLTIEIILKKKLFQH